MKKLLFLFAIVAASCSPEATTDATGEKGESLLQKMTINHNEADNFITAEYDKNEIEVGVSSNKLILLNKVDGVHEYFYSIQLKPEELEQFKGMENGTFEVANFLDDLIISNGKETFYFSTRKDFSRKALLKDAKSFSSLGIAKIYLDEKVPETVKGYTDFDELARKAPCQCVSVKSFERCESGGEGATSCSVAGCSVSCSERYFACCNSNPI